MKLNGCHNHPTYIKEYSANDMEIVVTRERTVRIPKTVYIPVRGSAECQYSVTNSDDPGCIGCRHQHQLSLPL